jgi:hypothetical protein
MKDVLTNRQAGTNELLTPRGSDKRFAYSPTGNDEGAICSVSDRQ